jgi:transcriptional regulator with XRE-family HTH domain
MKVRNAGSGDVVSRRDAGSSESEDTGELHDIVNSIGPKVRELRIQRGMSLQQLATLSDVSAAAIHKIERGGMVPTITTLLKIAAAFNRPVSYFVEEQPGENRPVAHVRKDGRGPIFTAHRGIELAGISGPYGRFFLAGAVATVQPGANSGDKPMEHPGEELIFILDGSFEIDVDGQHFFLDEGDSLHFRTDRPHRWHNTTSKPIKAVWLALRPF